MIKNIIVLAILVLSLIIGVSLFLQIDDLKMCDIRPSQVDGCQKADAIVAISGGDTLARTKEAIELFKNGWADELIFSGAAFDKSGPSNALEMKKIAMDMGISEDVIIIDEFAETTKQNAEYVSSILKNIDAKRIILVTSGYHQKRASFEFNQYLIHNSSLNVKVINHPTKYDKDWSLAWWLTPRGWWLAGSEVVKIIIFMVVGF